MVQIYCGLKHIHQSHGYFENAVKFKIQLRIKTDEYWIYINEHKERVLKMYHWGTCVTLSSGKALWIHFSKLLSVLTSLFSKRPYLNEQKMFQPLKNKSIFRGAIWYNHTKTAVGSSNKQSSSCVSHQHPSNSTVWLFLSPNCELSRYHFISQPRWSIMGDVFTFLRNKFEH